MEKSIDARKASVALLSVISNSTLVVSKLTIGLLIGSVSVISEAIHSAVDLLAAIIAYFAVKTAGIPEDEDHPYGHHKVENISGTIEALLIFLAAVWIIWEAVKKYLDKKPAEMEPGLGILVMLISVLANIYVSQRLFKVGKETDSVALQADAWHLRTDVYTSLGVMAGLALIYIGKLALPGVDLYWIDPIAAVAVALLIMKAAWDLTVESGKDLMDASLPPNEEKLIREQIIKHQPEVRGFHRLRTRKAGSKRFVQFHMLVNAEMSVEDSHTLHDHIVDSIKKHFPGAHVVIHIEPCNGECETICAGCLLDEDLRATIHAAKKGS